MSKRNRNLIDKGITGGNLSIEKIEQYTPEIIDDTKEVDEIDQYLADTINSLKNGNYKMVDTYVTAEEAVEVDFQKRIDTSSSLDNLFLESLYKINFDDKGLNGEPDLDSDLNLQTNIDSKAFDEVPYQLCLRLIKENKLRYICDPQGCLLLYIYKEKCWEYLDDNELRQLAYEILPKSLKMETKGVKALVTNIADYVKYELMKKYNQGIDVFSADDFKSVENHIVFENCVYDVKRGKVLKHSSKKPYLFKVNCDYIGEKETPVYNEFKINATNKDRESMQMFDFMQAYLLMPNKSGKCFFVFASARDSGKSTFGEFIEGYFSPSHVKRFDIQHSGGKFSNAGYQNAVLLSCLEMPTTQLTVSAVKALKNYTGECKIEIEEKYANHVTASVRFKVILATNGGLYLPNNQIDSAFYRRAIVIPFVQSMPFEKLDSNLLKKLNGERSAIISSCARKMHKLMKKSNCIVFPESELSKEIKAQWMGENFWAENFIKTHLEYTADEKDFISKREIAELYNKSYDDKYGDDLKNAPVKCDKDNLMRMIQSIYPKVASSKRRCGADNPIACLTCLRWTGMSVPVHRKPTKAL